ncbi:NADP-dependent oxidoreductase domain-containing protein [Lipomyces oligophaga]|uniref:NADP-dependent oxidoreductase domain-containing protein n=1 Tax=Lipomyces oligophaga TaxID=45792 RepID=UPI0034CE4AF2
MTSIKNRIILGLMTFGPPEVSFSRINSISEAAKVFQYLKDHGYSEIDTARMYIDGRQEAFTAEVGYKNYGLGIATKCFPVHQGEHSATELPKYLEKSLKELKTDSVDIFYLHAPDRKTPILETLQTMDKLHKEGKFKIFGVSNYSAFEVSEMVTLARVHGLLQPMLYQARYNCLARTIEPELIPALRRYGIDLVVYNPIAGGLLSGKYQKEVIPTAGRYAMDNWIGQMIRKRYFTEGHWRALEIIEQAAKKHNLTLPEIAFRWLVHHSMLRLGSASSQQGDGIIIGISAFDQLVSNLDDLEKGPLPKEILVAVDEAYHVAIPDVEPYFWGKLEYEYNY